jgi:hypothetical protein
MPDWLYEEVKAEIPPHIGVTNGEQVIKNPKKVPLSLPVETLYINIVCALNREADKYYNNQDEDVIAKYKRVIDRLEKERDKNYRNTTEWCNKYYQLKHEKDDELIS